MGSRSSYMCVKDATHINILFIQHIHMCTIYHGQSSRVFIIYYEYNENYFLYKMRHNLTTITNECVFGTYVLFKEY